MTHWKRLHFQPGAGEGARGPRKTNAKSKIEKATDTSTQYSAATGRAVARASTDHYVLACNGNLDISILPVSRFVGGIVANRILRSEFSGDLCKGVRQRANCI